MTRKISAITLMLASMVSCLQNPTTEADYHIIPLPEEITVTEGKPFILSEEVTIVYSEVPELENEARFLSGYIGQSTGIDVKVRAKAGSGRMITLSVDTDLPDREAYVIETDENSVMVRGGSEAGVFYGIQTLRKSLPVRQTSKVALPAAIIRDSPAYSYRGMMLDCGRHFFSVAEVKTYIDLLCLHNINRFHWHLTEDQGWRIDIRKYPQLTEKGAYRAQTMVGQNYNEFDGKPYGGFYTQDEIREIVAYASERHITIIPEVDMPGHMQAALASYPELGCTGGPYKVRETWGVSKDVLCAGKATTLQFAKDVLTEVMELFPSRYIHVGGDECDKYNWERCPRCQRKIKDLGLEDDALHTKEQKLQSWFIAEIESFLNSNGRKLIGWDEILEGGLAPDATVMVWRDEDKGKAALAQEHDAIMTTSSHLYFDMYQAFSKHEPLAIGGYSPVEHVYSYQPVPSGLDPDLERHILGIQANLWTEYIPTFSQVEYMVLPRMDALCEIQWSSEEHRDYKDFCKRLPKMLEIYDHYHYNYAQHLLDIRSASIMDNKTGEKTITLETIGDTEIHYTLDGSTPDRSSPVYTAPLVFQEDATLKAIAYHPSHTSNILEEEIILNKTVQEIQMVQSPDPKYSFGGAQTLIDGIPGDGSYRSGKWLGWCGNDVEVILVLKNKMKMSSLKFNTFVKTGDWIFDTRNVTIAVSDDGKEYREVAMKEYPALSAGIQDEILPHEFHFTPVEARWFKIRIGTEHDIPEWHSAHGNPAFIFIDELLLRQE